MDAYLESLISKYINLESPISRIVLTLILIWSILWKILGLWKSAKGDEKLWFLIIFFLNTVGILEIFYLFVFSKQKLTKEQVLQNIKTIKIINLRRIFGKE